MKTKSDKAQYYFYFNILQGFELATALPENQLDTRVELKIGQLTAEETSQLVTDHKKGHYPIWNKFDFVMVKLQKEMMFEADLRVSIYNRKSKWLFEGYRNILIGEFCVPVQSLLKKCDKP